MTAAITAVDTDFNLPAPLAAPVLATSSATAQLPSARKNEVRGEEGVASASGQDNDCTPEDDKKSDGAASDDTIESIRSIDVELDSTSRRRPSGERSRDLLSNEEDSVDRDDSANGAGVGIEDDRIVKSDAAVNRDVTLFIATTATAGLLSTIFSSSSSSSAVVEPRRTRISTGAAASNPFVPDPENILRSKNGPRLVTDVVSDFPHAGYDDEGYRIHGKMPPLQNWLPLGQAGYTKCGQRFWQTDDGQLFEYERNADSSDGLSHNFIVIREIEKNKKLTPKLPNSIRSEWLADDLQHHQQKLSIDEDREEDSTGARARHDRSLSEQSVVGVREEDSASLSAITPVAPEVLRQEGDNRGLSIESASASHRHPDNSAFATMMPDEHPAAVSAEEGESATLSFGVGDIKTKANESKSTTASGGTSPEATKSLSGGADSTTVRAKNRSCSRERLQEAQSSLQNGNAERDYWPGRGHHPSETARLTGRFYSKPDGRGFAFLREWNTEREFFVPPPELERLQREHPNMPRQAAVFFEVRPDRHYSGKFNAVNLSLPDNELNHIDEKRRLWENISRLGDRNRLADPDRALMTHSIISGTKGDRAFPPQLFVDDQAQKGELHETMAQLQAQGFQTPSITEKASFPNFNWFQDVDILIPPPADFHGTGNLQPPELSKEEEQHWVHRCVQILAAAVTPYWQEIDADGCPVMDESGRPKLKSSTRCLITSATGFAQHPYCQQKISLHIVWPDCVIDKERARKLWQLAVNAAGEIKMTPLNKPGSNPISEQVHAASSSSSATSASSSSTLKRPAGGPAATVPVDEQIVDWTTVFDKGSSHGDSLRMMYADKWNKQDLKYEGRRKMPYGLYEVTLTRKPEDFAMKLLKGPTDLQEKEWLDLASIRVSQTKKLVELCLPTDTVIQKLTERANRPTARDMARFKDMLEQKRRKTKQSATCTGANSVELGQPKVNVRQLPEPAATSSSSSSSSTARGPPLPILKSRREVEEKEMIGVAGYGRKRRSRSSSRRRSRSRKRSRRDDRDVDKRPPILRPAMNSRPPTARGRTIVGSNGGGKRKPKRSRTPRRGRVGKDGDHYGKGKGRGRRDHRSCSSRDNYRQHNYGSCKGRRRSRERDYEDDFEAKGKGKTGKGKHGMYGYPNDERAEWSSSSASAANHNGWYGASSRDLNKNQSSFEQFDAAVPIQYRMHVAACNLNTQTNTCDLRAVLSKEGGVDLCFQMTFEGLLDAKPLIKLSDATASFAALAFGLAILLQKETHAFRKKQPVGIAVHTDNNSLLSMMNNKAKTHPPGSQELRDLLRDMKFEDNFQLQACEERKGTNIAKQVKDGERADVECVRQALLSGLKYQGSAFSYSNMHQNHPRRC
ncbi:unnamed protein product [Amoebophrya sp. A120]|nr:unnamed protein product [Amoebophrya sp. A120]|eukprot:GSA120T00017624001.1